MEDARSASRRLTGVHILAQAFSDPLSQPCQPHNEVTGSSSSILLNQQSHSMVNFLQYTLPVRLTSECVNPDPERGFTISSESRGRPNITDQDKVNTVYFQTQLHTAAAHLFSHNCPVSSKHQPRSLTYDLPCFILNPALMQGVAITVGALARRSPSSPYNMLSRVRRVRGPGPASN